VFRITSTVAAVMLFDQAVFAGQFLDGTHGSLHVHRENATFAGISVLISIVAAVLVRRPGRGQWWPIAASAGIFGLVALQIILGFARAISLHVPLGVATIGLAAAIAVWAWRRG
jgi:heme A synthase